MLRFAVPAPVRALGFFSLVSLLPSAGKCAEPIPTYNPGNGHYYETIEVPTPITWADANTAAKRKMLKGMPGHLVTITSQEEYDFLDRYTWIREFFVGGHRPILGGSDLKVGWRWVTGEPWEYSRWGGNFDPRLSPGQDLYAHFWTAAKTWSATDINGKLKGYVVEFDTAYEPDRAAETPSVQAAELLSQVWKRYQSFKTYSETVEFAVADFYKNTLDSARGEFEFSRPGRFRLVGSGADGKVTAVADETTLFMIDRTQPDTYVRRPVGPFSQAISEGLQVMSSSCQAPTLLGLLNDPQPTEENTSWLREAKLGEIIEGDDPGQALYAHVKISFNGQPNIDATYKAIISLKDLLIREASLEFKYQLTPFTVHEYHKNIEINSAIPADDFTYAIPKNAERVRRLTDGAGR